MFSLIHYELNKIIRNKATIIAIFCLFLINAIVCLYYTYDNSPLIPHDDLAEFISLYRNNPEAILNEYEHYIALQNEQDALWISAVAQGNFNYKQVPIPNHYSESEKYSDSDLYYELFHRISIIEDFQTKIKSTILQAQNNITELHSRGYNTEDYLYNKQIRSISQYEAVLENTSLIFEHTRGWDSFFLYDSVNIFIFFAILILSCTIFTQESQYGILPLIRISSNGRSPTVWAKLITTLIITFVTVILFLLESWILVGISSGYSSISNGLQVFEYFTYCPYSLKIYEYLLIFILTKFIVSFFIALSVLFFSCIVNSYLLVYTFGICLYGINFVLFTIPYLNSNSIFLNLNLVSLLSVNPLFSNFTILNLFNVAIECIPFASILLLLLLPTFSFLIYYQFCNNTVSFPTFSITRICDPLYSLKSNILSFPHFSIRYSSSIFPFEIHKTLFSTRLILILIILLGIKVIVSSHEYMVQNSYADAVYKEYMTTLSGEITDAKLDYLLQERNMINENILIYPLMQDKYANNEISLAEYGDYLKNYNYAVNRDDILKSVENHADYIARMQKNGHSPWFVYDSGWNKLFFTSFDWTLYLAIFLLFTGSFTIEYSKQSSLGSFATILRTTSKGRQNTWNAKFNTTSVLTIMLTIIWNIIDIYFLLSAYELPLLNAPLISIEKFSSFIFDISIIEFTVIFYALKLLAVLLFALSLCFLSAILRKNILIMTLTAIITLIPSVLSSFGMYIFDHIDYIKFMQATPLLLSLPVSIVYISLFVILCFFLALLSRRFWLK